MIGESFDTEVAGEPASLVECARWLRTTLRGEVLDAGDAQGRARRQAGAGWDGAAGEAYRDVGAAALVVTDEHAERVGRAADDVADVADRLRVLEDTMADVRARARDGGMGVNGTLVSQPIALDLTGPPGGGVGPGGLGGDDAVLFAELRDEAREARAAYADWVEGHLERARTAAATRGDLDRVLRGLAGAGGSSGAVVPPPPAKPASTMPPATLPVAAEPTPGEGRPAPGDERLAGGPRGEPSVVSTPRGADVLVARDGPAGPPEGRPMVVGTLRDADLPGARRRGDDLTHHVVTSPPRVRTHVTERPLDH